MRFGNLCAVILMTIVVSACGGGGENISTTPTTPTTSTPTPTPTPTLTPTPVPVMSCANNAIWSNPAVFSTVFQDCVAQVGVQAKMDAALNTMTDTSCVITVGVQLTAPCKAYMANGTMLMADTGILVNGHTAAWMAYYAKDGSSNLVLLDAITLTPVGKLVLPDLLIWEIGNPPGVDIEVKVSVNGVLRNMQVSWNGSDLVLKCQLNCS